MVIKRDQAIRYHKYSIKKNYKAHLARKSVSGTFVYLEYAF